MSIKINSIQKKWLCIPFIFLSFFLWSTWITDEFPSFRRSKNLRHDGKAVAIYHTAGKGTRLAPLPGAENNNKPGGDWRFFRTPPWDGMGWDGSPKWWFCKGNPLISGKSGLVKYYNLTRWMGWRTCRGRSYLACWWHIWHLAGVKLPGLLSVNGQLEPITVLECVLRWSLRTGRAMKGDFNWHDMM